MRFANEEAHTANAGLKTEIAEHNITEKELEKSLSLVNATLESTADGLIVLDLQNKIVRSNQRFQDLLRIPSEMINQGNGEAIFQFISRQATNPDDLINRQSERRRSPTEEAYAILEFKDGKVIEIHSSPYRLAMQTAGQVWSFRDITERVQAEKVFALRQATII